MTVKKSGLFVLEKYDLFYLYTQVFYRSTLQKLDNKSR